MSDLPPFVADQQEAVARIAAAFPGPNGTRAPVRLRGSGQATGAIVCSVDVPLEPGNLAALHVAISPFGSITNVTIEPPDAAKQQSVAEEVIFAQQARIRELEGQVGDLMDEAAARSLEVLEQIRAGLKAVRDLAGDYAETDGEQHKQWALIEIFRLAGGDPDDLSVDDRGTQA